MKLRHLVLILSFTASLALSNLGCLNLKPVADPIRYFLVYSTATPDNRAEKPSDTALGIASVTLPEYLKSPWMAVRTSETEIHYADYNKWGEPLDKGIQRVVADNLASLLGTDRIRLDSWSKEDVDTKLLLTVDRCEPDESGEVVLEARWQISGSHSATGHQVVRKSGPAPLKDPAGSAAAISEALEELARLIAVDLQPPKATPGG